MFPLARPNLTANGNVRPGRFITSVSGNGNFLLAVEATASTAPIFGVSARGTRGPAGVDETYCAIAGESLPYHGQGEIAELLLGASVTNMGVPLTTDNQGRGTPLAPTDGTTTYYGAIPLRPGLINEYIPVWVLFGFAV